MHSSIRILLFIYSLLFTFCWVGEPWFLLLKNERDSGLAENEAGASRVELIKITPMQHQQNWPRFSLGLTCLFLLWGGMCGGRIGGFMSSHRRSCRGNVNLIIIIIIIIIKMSVNNFYLPQNPLTAPSELFRVPLQHSKGFSDVFFFFFWLPGAVKMVSVGGQTAPPPPIPWPYLGH